MEAVQNPEDPPGDAEDLDSRLLPEPLPGILRELVGAVEDRFRQVLWQESVLFRYLS